jgi:hypothetical protein
VKLWTIAARRILSGDNYLFACLAVGQVKSFGSCHPCQSTSVWLERCLLSHCPGSCDPRNYSYTVTGMPCFERIYKTNLQDFICVVIVIVVLRIRWGISHKLTRRRGQSFS